MSVQFGRWNYEGAPASPKHLEKVRTLMEAYGPDGSRTYSAGGVDILYGAFHTTKESRAASQPFVTQSGAVLTWDGRLDNRSEFIALMSDRLRTDSPDVSVVASAYERWGTDCLARFVGDWALAIWSPDDSSLILARDFVGTRHLYYTFDDQQISWSTILDPFVLLTQTPYALDEEFLAGWLSSFPAAHLTPYVGIYSVPPCSFVRLKSAGRIVGRYWDFDRAKKIRYRTDAEYEEHFRVGFGQAVERRLRADGPVLAELSGGMDSSSIVCMADVLIARGTAKTPRLDTLSYHNDSEPNWDERYWFTKVEEKRGRTGCHIDAGAPDYFGPGDETSAASPGAKVRPTARTRQLEACIRSQGNRVLLSGIGGDEFLGGVPTPGPEIADLLAKARFRELAHRLKVWALQSRTPWFHLLPEAVGGFLPLPDTCLREYKRSTAWLAPAFAKRERNALGGYRIRLTILGALPSFQENLHTLEALRRQLTCLPVERFPLVEKRYPCLDRDLLEFLFAIPREQLVRPGERRSLMRRALAGIVPEEVLNRKRKAFVLRTPMAAISEQWTALSTGGEGLVMERLGIADTKRLAEAVAKVRSGREVPLVPLMRALALEHWLRHLKKGNFLPPRMANRSERPVRRSIVEQRVPRSAALKDGTSHEVTL